VVRQGPGRPTAITIPKRFGDGGIRDKSVVLRPDRDEMVVGPIHGRTYRQYDLTPQQYESLTKLVAALGTVLPRITVDYPKDTGGQLITTELTDEQWKAYTGVLGHYHVQRNKQDPGPALQWDRVISGARRLMSPEALKRNDAMRGQAVEHREGRAPVPSRRRATDRPHSRDRRRGPPRGRAPCHRPPRRPTRHLRHPRPTPWPPAFGHCSTGSTHTGAVVAARVIELPNGRELYADRADEASSRPAT
jgi:hypothetical protein